MSRKVTILRRLSAALIGFFVLGVAPLAAQQCFIGSFCDRDGDGFIRDHKRCTNCLGPPVLDCDDGVFSSDNDCSGGGETTEDPDERVRVSVDVDSAIQDEGKTLPTYPLYSCLANRTVDYWNTIGGGQDMNCEDPRTQRVSSAIVNRQNFHFNTFGWPRPASLHDNTTKRFVTVDFGAGCVVPDIYAEIYANACQPSNTDCLASIPPEATIACQQNLEIFFETPYPFSGLPTTDPAFEIEIQTPMVKKNGRHVWQTRFRLQYAGGAEITPDTVDENRSTLESVGAATLVRVSDGQEWEVTTPLEWDLQRVFWSGNDSECCFEEWPPPTTP